MVASLPLLLKLIPLGLICCILPHAAPTCDGHHRIRRRISRSEPARQQSDTRARRFGSPVSVELDAIDPDTLRGLVRQVIERHMPRRRFKALMAQEERERSDITRMVNLIERRER